MTTIITPVSAQAGAAIGRLPGFGRLTSKELTEWRRGKRAWVVFLVSTSFMVLAAMNAWIVAQLAPLQSEPVPIPSQDPLLNLAGAVSSQIFLIVAVFATMALLAAERESGTLSWTASKPVSRAMSRSCARVKAVSAITGRRGPPAASRSRRARTKA